MKKILTLGALVAMILSCGTPPPPPGPKLIVAVAPAENRTTENILTEMMDAATESATIELDKTRWFQILERTRIGEVVQEAETAALGSGDAFLQAGQQIGAEAVFFSTFVFAGGLKEVREDEENIFQVYPVRIQGRLVSVDTKAILASAQVEYEAWHTIFERYTETVARNGTLEEVEMVDENEPLEEAQIAQRAVTEAYTLLVEELVKNLNDRRNP